MPKYVIGDGYTSQIAEGNGNIQEMNPPINSNEGGRREPETHKKSEEPKKNTVPFLSDLESEICDIFKSVYQKERKEDASDVNSKTLEFLKYRYCPTIR